MQTTHDAPSGTTGRLRILAVAATAALMASSLAAIGPAAAAGQCDDAGGPGGDWPVFQADVTATGNQPAETTIGPDNVGDLAPAWAFQLDGAIESPPVASGGCVFMNTQAGDIYAIDIATGQIAWQAKVPSATTLSTNGGRVFVQSASLITALDQTTGVQLWQKDFSPYSSIGSPLATDDFVVFGMSGCSDFGSRPTPCEGYYALLDPTTGDVLVDGHDVSPEDQANGMEGPGFWSHPSYDPEDKYVYFGTANVRSIAPENPYSNALLKIDADPLRETYGEIVGHYHRLPLNALNDTPVAQDACAPSPASLAVSVVCIDDDDLPSTAVIYRDGNDEKRVGVIHSGHRVPLRTFASFVVPEGEYSSLDPDTMQPVWTSPTTGARAAVAAYDGQRIFYSSGFNGEIVAVDKTTGDVQWTNQTLGVNVWQHVATANGVVYTPSGQPAAMASSNPLASLLAFDAETGELLLQRFLSQDLQTLATGTVAGGVAIARNTVFVPTNGDAGSYLVAYRLPA